MFGGKGGVGKTVLAAATAYYLAKQGKRVLVFSGDPQGSLSDIFQKDIFGKGPTEIVPNLYAREIDAVQRIEKLQQETRQKILDLHGVEMLSDEIENHIRTAAMAPGVEESAIFDGFVDIAAKGGYDYYIYDMPPLGHALSYLSMASLHNEWAGKIVGLREQMREYDQVAAVMRRGKGMDDDAMLNELLSIKERLNRSSEILTDKEKTAFFFVIAPRRWRLPIRSARRSFLRGSTSP